MITFYDRNFPAPKLHIDEQEQKIKSNQSTSAITINISKSHIVMNL